MQVYYISKALALGLLIPMAAAAWFSIHLARADAQFLERSPESVARAIEIEPRNTDYLALRALQLDYDGADSTAILERAVLLSPLSSAPRIRLGLAAEIRGDRVTAEKWLLEAARIDRQYEPRWTLANFYFRQGDADHFFMWIRSALEISYGDRRLAFDLAWRMGNAATVLARAIPDRRDVLSAYIWYLLDAHRDAVAPAALRLSALHDPSDRGELLVACDAILESDAAGARQLWTALGYAASAGVVNGNFEQEPVAHGFDWRPAAVVGIAQGAIAQPRPAWRIKLDGRQPESCMLISQVVTLEPGVSYTLRWDAQTSELSKPSGLEWRIGSQRNPVEAGSMDWQATSDSTLALWYVRPLGQARAEGSIEIMQVAIEKQ